MGRERQTLTTAPYYWHKRMSYERRHDDVRARTRHTQLGNGICELCGSKVERMHYHHWDDDNPSMGLWLCPRDHRHAEGFDQAINDPALLARYALLKATVSRMYHESRL